VNKQRLLKKLEDWPENKDNLQKGRPPALYKKDLALFAYTYCTTNLSIPQLAQKFDISICTAKNYAAMFKDFGRFNSQSENVEETQKKIRRRLSIQNKHIEFSPVQ